MDPTEAFSAGRDASRAYVQTLSEAQAELGSLASPAGFEAYHEATQAAVNDARLVAQLMLHATERLRPVEDVTKEYELRLSPEALAKTRKRREEELARAQRMAGTHSAP